MRYRKLFPRMLLIILLASVLASAFTIQEGKCEDGTIYIRADGSVDPPEAPIQRIGNTYEFSANIYGHIIVERDYITIDGNGYSVEGSGSGSGIYIQDNVFFAITEVTVTGFDYGIQIVSSIGWIYSCAITGNRLGGISFSGSWNGTVFGNDISYNSGSGIIVHDTTSLFSYAFLGNNIAYNNVGVSLLRTSDNVFSCNNFIGNIENVYLSDATNYYVHNFWDDYTGADANGDGIGDTPYIKDANNKDDYPIMLPYSEPVPDFTFSPTNPVVNEEIIFDASDSYGVIHSYVFNFGDGRIISIEGLFGPKVQHSYSSAGIYEVTLTVFDYFGAALKSTSHEVNVQVGNLADFTFFPRFPKVNEEILFDASASTGEITSYEWDFGDGSSTSGIMVYHSYSSAGTYEVTLTVTDSEGATDSISRLVVITNPTADFSISVSPASQTIKPGRSTRFTVTVSAIGGFSSPVTINSLISPSSDDISLAYASWLVTPLPDGSTWLTLTVSASKSAKFNFYTIRITGTSEGKSHSAIVTLAVASYELFFEIDYMEGCRPTDSVLAYIRDYYIEDGIALFFDVNDTVPYNSILTDEKIWEIEREYNDGSWASDKSKGVYFSKSKWVLYCNESDRNDKPSGRCHVPGNYEKDLMVPGKSTLGGNYIIIYDAYNDKRGYSPERAETVALMHEMGHSIGILQLGLAWKDGRLIWDEFYDLESTSVMAQMRSYNVNAEPIHYSWFYWNLKDLQYYKI